MSEPAGAARPRPHPMRSLLILGAAALSFALAQTSLVPAIQDPIGRPGAGEHLTVAEELGAAGPVGEAARSLS
jgi:hypothetical protein